MGFIWLTHSLLTISSNQNKQNNFALDLTYLILLNGQPPLNLS